MFLRRETRSWDWLPAIYARGFLVGTLFLDSPARSSDAYEAKHSQFRERIDAVSSLLLVHLLPRSIYRRSSTRRFVDEPIRNDNAIIARVATNGTIERKNGRREEKSRRRDRGCNWSRNWPRDQLRPSRIIISTFARAFARHTRRRGHGTESGRG